MAFSYIPLPPFAATSGPINARTLFVGEAWGGQDSEIGKPLTGSAGQEFWRMICETRGLPPVTGYGPGWIREREHVLIEHSIAMTNVLAFRPPDNRLDALCHQAGGRGPGYPWPAMSMGKYLDVKFAPELERLFVEIDIMRPNIIVALGNTACWALLGVTNIGSIRGTIAESIPIRGRRYKVLPTYHPAGVMRNWAWRPIVVADLMKAGREAGSPEIVRPRREVLINPSLEEIREWIDGCPRKCILAVDIETAGGQIKCIGFATSRERAMVVPFWAPGSPGGNYWATPGEERAAWDLVEELLVAPWGKLFQNGMYDIQYLTRMGLRLTNCLHDTMLMHHSLFPEMQKGLGFLGSIYTQEASWKLMRRQKVDTEKRDE